MAAAEQRRSTSGGLLSQRIAGVPVPVLAVLVGAVGLYLYRKRAAAKTAAAGQQSAANSAQLATTGTSYGDPVLTAYQTGEAAGVASYSAGVTSGISLVDSILGMFPAAPTTAQAGGSAAQQIGSGYPGSPALPGPTVGTTGPGGTTTGALTPTTPAGSGTLGPILTPGYQATNPSGMSNNPTS